MRNIRWTDHVSNDEVLEKLGKKRTNSYQKKKERLEISRAYKEEREIGNSCSYIWKVSGTEQ